MWYIKYIWVWKLDGRGKKRLTNQKYIKKQGKQMELTPII